MRSCERRCRSCTIKRWRKNMKSGKDSCQGYKNLSSSYARMPRRSNKHRLTERNAMWSRLMVDNTFRCKNHAIYLKNTNPNPWCLRDNPWYPSNSLIITILKIITPTSQQSSIISNTIKGRKTVQIPPKMKMNTPILMMTIQAWSWKQTRGPMTFKGKLPFLIL